MNIIDGKVVSQNIRQEISREVATLNEQGKNVGLAVIIIGQDPASKVYVKNKINACKETNIQSFLYELDANISQDYVLNLIDTLNKDDNVNGILVQLPIPKHLDKEEILSKITVEKDVDGFSAEQAGKMFLGEEALVSCTPQGIIELLKAYNVEIEGRNAVVVGRSNIVGKPVATLLLQENATVTVCHSKTKNLSQFTSNADILVTAIGKAKFITKDMIKNGAVIVDAGINRDENGKLCGDVDFDDVFDKCSLITPVPGGVGPMTVTMLLKNTLIAAKNGTK